MKTLMCAKGVLGFLGVLGALRRLFRDSGESTGAFWRAGTPSPALRAEIESAGFSESLRGWSRNRGGAYAPAGGHPGLRSLNHILWM
jgi:hypothetical protein